MVSVVKAILKFNHGLIGLIEVARAKEKSIPVLIHGVVACRSVGINCRLIASLVTGRMKSS